MGATNLNEDAQDSQALRPWSSFTQAVIGIRIIMYDVELRGKGSESFNVSPLPPPKGFDPSCHHHHLQYALSLSHQGLVLSSKYDFSQFPDPPFPGIDHAFHCVLVQASLPGYLCSCGFTVDLVF